MSDPSVTDWIQAVGVIITLPTAFFAIYSLFRKDKDKQAQLNSLAMIVEKQSSIIAEMKGMLLESQRQTSILSDANEIFRLQLQVQTESFLDDRTYKANILRIEQLKKRQEIRPEFKITGGTQSSSAITIPIKNMRSRAVSPEIDILRQDCVQINKTNLPDYLENNQGFEIKGIIDVEGNTPKRYECQIKILYKDEENNRYEQVLTYGNKGKSKITMPQFLNEAELTEEQN